MPQAQVSEKPKPKPLYPKGQHPTSDSIVADDWSKDSNRSFVDSRTAPAPAIDPRTGDPVVPVKPKVYDVFDDANRYLNHDGPKYDFLYPFETINEGQGFFVPLEQSMTIDTLTTRMYIAIDDFHKQTGSIEKDKNGDDILEVLTTMAKKRNPDGTIKMDAFGKPEMGVGNISRPKMNHVAEFIVKPAINGDEIAKGRKADADGVLVIRVA